MKLNLQYASFKLKGGGRRSARGFSQRLKFIPRKIFSKKYTNELSNAGQNNIIIKNI